MEERVTKEQEKVNRQTNVCVKLWWMMTFTWVITGLVLVTMGGPFGTSSNNFSHDDIFSRTTLQMLHPLLYTCGFVSLACFLIGQITGNVSQVDKLWSILPPLYTILVTILVCPHWSPRLVLMSMLTSLWGARLTYNFSRRGGYAWPPWTGEEDYRWAIVRTWPGLRTSFGWVLFNLIFISIYQNILLLLITLPSLASIHTSAELNIIDLLATVSFLVLLVLETVADQQQFEFQTEKWQQKIRNPPYDVGFVTSGLFSLSRHPNYLAEQLLWCVFYLFSVSATGRWFNVTMIGSFLLVVLFQGSTMLSEGITSDKYPAYRKYKDSVPMFLGNLWSLAPNYTPIIMKK